MRYRALALMIAATAFLAGCQTTRPGNFCDVAAPIRPTAADVELISDTLVSQVLGHNEYGAKACKWTP